MKRALLAVALMFALAACNTNRVPEASYGVVVHGFQVEIVVIPGGEAWHRYGKVHVGRNARTSHEGWAELLTHEVCHALDHYAGRPSSDWPEGDDPTQVWGHRNNERWAETCSWMWMNREDSLKFVTPPPRFGLDARQAPKSWEVTQSEWRDYCSEVGHPFLCPGGEA